MVEETSSVHSIEIALRGFEFALLLAVIAFFVAKRIGFFKGVPSSENLLAIRGSRVLIGFSFFLAGALLISPASTVVVFYLKGYSPKEILYLVQWGPLKGWASLISMVVGLLSMALAVWELKPQEKQVVFGQEEGAKQNLLIGMASWLISYPFILCISQVFSILIALEWHPPQVDQVAVKYLKALMNDPFLFYLNVLAIVSAVPLTEELLFRGLLQSWLRSKIGWKGAIIITSVIFALFHFSFSQGLSNIELLSSLFVLSCFLGFLYERQRSIWAPIGLHACFNAVSVLLIMIA